MDAVSSLISENIDSFFEIMLFLQTLFHLRCFFPVFLFFAVIFISLQAFFRYLTIPGFLLGLRKMKELIKALKPWVKPTDNELH